MPIRLGVPRPPEDGVALGAAVREHGVMKKDRPRPVELVCVDCGRPVAPTEVLEIRLTTKVMKVCPSCRLGVLRPGEVWTAIDDDAEGK